MGASQKSQSCFRYTPPAKKATPVLRAGLTEVLVTGMLIRWIRVRARPMAMGAKPLGAPSLVAPMMMNTKKPVSSISATSAAVRE